MIEQAVKPLFAIVLAVSLSVIAGSASAQSKGGTDDFRIVRVLPDFVDTPDIAFGGNFRKKGIVGGTPVKWLRIEVEFSSKPEWADDVEVRWFILPTEDKDSVMFTDSVNHINVKRGAHHYSAIFVPPRTVDRYLRNFRVRQIAVQIWHNQKLMDMGGWPSTPSKRWWEEYTPSRGALLNLLETPFGMLEYDRYEQIRTTPPNR